MTTHIDLALEEGAHVCHLFETTEEQKTVAWSFLLDGLNQGESCFYTVGRQSVEACLAELQEIGIDVASEIRRKALSVDTGANYRRTGEFSSISQARSILSDINERLKDFPAVRLIGDVAWELPPSIPVDDVCHWEAAANLVFEKSPVRTICQYDLVNDSPALLHSALRTHSQVILGGRVYKNPFNEASKILANKPYLNHSNGDAAQIQDMLRRIMFPGAGIARN